MQAVTDRVRATPEPRNHDDESAGLRRLVDRQLNEWGQVEEWGDDRRFIPCSPELRSAPGDGLFLATAHNAASTIHHERARLLGALQGVLLGKLAARDWSVPEEQETYAVRAAVNGCATELVNDSATKVEQVGGGLRGRVRGQSRQCRSRLIRRLGAVDQKAYPATHVLFVTLTYHRSWPPTPEGWKRHIEEWKRRVERKHGHLCGVWVKEFQKRGAPHFHLILFLDAPASEELHHTMWEAWHDIAGNGSHWHMRYGFMAETPRTWRGVISYASKYISKDDQHHYMSPDGELLPTGRMWGMLRPKELAIRYELHRITYHQYLSLRRWFRRRSQPRTGRHRSRCHRSNLNNQHVLLDYGELNRLLAWLGIIGSDPPDLYSLSALH